LFDLRVSLESFSTDKNIVTLEYKDKTGFLWRNIIYLFQSCFRFIF
jgi:hypothetical protein